MAYELAKIETPLEQLEQWEHYGDAAHFAFVDFLLATPNVTEEQIFERTGIRLSDFDYVEDDGEEYGWSAAGFRLAVIQVAFDSGFLSDHFWMAIEHGDTISSLGDGWTTVELYELYRYLKAVFDPPRGGAEFFAGCATSLGLQSSETQPA